jgi:hypothetical protein
MKWTKYILSICMIFSINVSAEVPYEFSSHTQAKASEVNLNFQNIDSRLQGTITKIGQQQFSSSAEIGVAVQCPDDRVVTGVGCDCISDFENRNPGLLVMCQLIGNSGVGGCANDTNLYERSRSDPVVTVTVSCRSCSGEDGSDCNISAGEPLVTASANTESIADNESSNEISQSSSGNNYGSGDKRFSNLGENLVKRFKEQSDERRKRLE